LRDGTSMPMPLVHGGVMYLLTFPDTALALDASNGQVLWRHRYEPQGSPSSQKMGLALQGDKVFMPTSDLHVLALSAKTGELVWDHKIAPPTAPPKRPSALPISYQLRSPPLVVGDKVIQGVTASFVPMGGFAVAIDVASGKEAWRFNTIARPGEPNGDSWNDVPLEKRSGGSIWHELSYDPELDLVYFGIAPTYDTGPLLHPSANTAVNANALYTNCTVAIRPKTGELAWYYQHVANDQWDLDWVFERTIVNVPWDGKTRKAVMNVGKMGILEALDATTGEYLFSVDAGIQNVITAIDPKTGAKTIDPGKLPDPKRPTDVCPSAIGARSWPPTSYSPKTQLAYLPLTESCMRLGPQGFRLLTSGVGISGATHPATADGKNGRLQAIDLANRKLGWTTDLVNAPTTGLLATAGGVVFVGDLDPSLKAVDDTTGELLWSTKLDNAPSSGLVTYRVKDKQYLAVVVGMHNFHVDGVARSLDRLLAGDVASGGGAAAGGAPPAAAAAAAGGAAARGAAMTDGTKGGAAIWVFGL
jgi:alcohol dehydrogenase (cytochrome c)